MAASFPGDGTGCMLEDHSLVMGWDLCLVHQVQEVLPPDRDGVVLLGSPGVVLLGSPGPGGPPK